MIPIFIGGCDRSGTTLLGAMLGSHSKCLCIPEFQSKIEVFQHIKHWDNNLNIKEVFEMLKNHWRFRIWELDINLDPDSQNVIGSSYSRLIEFIIKKYGEKVYKLSPEFWVDHSPSNIQFAYSLFNLFPKAKMIHIVRDGRAVANSVLRLDWGPNTIVRAAPWWLENISYGLCAESLFGDKHVIRVRYEDLVLKPEITLKNICSFMNIVYQPEMSKAIGFRVPSYTERQHNMVGQELNRKRIEAWESELTERQIEIFENLTGEMLLYLGNTLKFSLSNRTVSRAERFKADIREIYAKYLINRLRYGLRVRRAISKKRDT